MSKLTCWCKCLFWWLIALVLVAEFIALPTVGLVWWFVTKTPEQFLLTSIAISLLWIGIGVCLFLMFVGGGKYIELSRRNPKPKQC
ncbi:MAG: hypothetical protein A3F17_08760 [Gammaproteobacteria bacterium RIFCSPHIGHO2_12_FULL_41_15]|nr:MAG: hypothetical protein A3F17_08760 [Gammaproteobacteria bacterium RIFCSPHIGHO2_12_FULL_41_15]